MDHNERGRTMNIQLINQVEDEVADDNYEEIDLQKASASSYERFRKYRIKSQKADLFIVVGLYLTLINLTIVVL